MYVLSACIRNCTEPSLKLYVQPVQQSAVVLLTTGSYSNLNFMDSRGSWREFSPCCFGLGKSKVLNYNNNNVYMTDSHDSVYHKHNNE